MRPRLAIVSYGTRRLPGTADYVKTMIIQVLCSRWMELYGVLLTQQTVLVADMFAFRTREPSITTILKSSSCRDLTRYIEYS